MMVKEKSAERVGSPATPAICLIAHNAYGALCGGKNGFVMSGTSIPIVNSMLVITSHAPTHRMASVRSCSSALATTL